MDRATDGCFKCLDACVGADCTLDNRLHYALAYKRHEAAYASARALVAAHRRAHGRGDADTTESQRDMLDLTMTNAWSATTTASTRTRHRVTEELSET